MALPRLLIDSDLNSSFAIEELTFNPNISRQAIFNRDAAPPEIWLELSLRQGISDDPVAKPVPSLRFHFYGDNADTFVPATTLYDVTKLPQELSDANFVMFSDIWYSFVRLDGEDREFMEYGYRNPVRIIANAELPDPGDYWITGGNRCFRSEDYQNEMDSLRRRVSKFHQELLPFESTRDRRWEYEASRRNWIPKDRTAYAPARFEIVSRLRGRFAFKRDPWTSSTYGYGTSYGGTAKVTKRSDCEYSVSPYLFSPTDSSPVPCELAPGEIVRFWVRFTASSCISLPTSRPDRLSFHFQLETIPRVDVFNTFFRIPLGFEAIPGAITPLKHYATPPRLFFIWDKYLPEQCLYYSEEPQSANARVGINTAFTDMTADTYRLIRLFILGVFLGVLGNLLISAIYTDPPKDTILSLSRFAVTAPIAILLSTVPAIRIYIGKRTNIFTGMLSVTMVLAVFIIYDLSPLVSYVTIVSAITLYIHSMHLHIYAQARAKSQTTWARLRRGPLARPLLRRQYLRKLHTVSAP